MATSNTKNRGTEHEKLSQWVDEIANLTQPHAIYWCDGSIEEWDRLTSELVTAKTLV